jgi:hypothetical protein
MDPVATWTAFLRSYRDDDEEACRQCCRDLLAWLAKGGFPPPIINIAAFDRVMVQAVCTTYLSRLAQGESLP